MSIKEYNQNNTKLYHVNIRVGSHKSVRVQLNKKGITSYKKALNIENRKNVLIQKMQITQQHKNNNNQLQ